MHVRCGTSIQNAGEEWLSCSLGQRSYRTGDDDVHCGIAMRSLTKDAGGLVRR
jgi:hypothetical protein